MRHQQNPDSAEAGPLAAIVNDDVPLPELWENIEKIAEAAKAFPVGIMQYDLGEYLRVAIGLREAGWSPSYRSYAWRLQYGDFCQNDVKHLQLRDKSFLYLLSTSEGLSVLEQSAALIHDTNGCGILAFIDSDLSLNKTITGVIHELTKPTSGFISPYYDRYKNALRVFLEKGLHFLSQIDFNQAQCDSRVGADCVEVIPVVQRLSESERKAGQTDPDHVKALDDASIPMAMMDSLNRESVENKVLAPFLPKQFNALLRDRSLANPANHKRFTAIHFLVKVTHIPIDMVAEYVCDIVVPQGLAWRPGKRAKALKKSNPHLLAREKVLNLFTKDGSSRRSIKKKNKDEIHCIQLRNHFLTQWLSDRVGSTVNLVPSHNQFVVSHPRNNLKNEDLDNVLGLMLKEIRAALDEREFPINRPFIRDYLIYWGETYCYMMGKRAKQTKKGQAKIAAVVKLVKFLDSPFKQNSLATIAPLFEEARSAQNADPHVLKRIGGMLTRMAAKAHIKSHDRVHNFTNMIADLMLPGGKGEVKQHLLMKKLKAEYADQIASAEARAIQEGYSTPATEERDLVAAYRVQHPLGQGWYDEPCSVGGGSLRADVKAEACDVKEPAIARRAAPVVAVPVEETGVPTKVQQRANAKVLLMMGQGPASLSGKEQIGVLQAIYWFKVNGEDVDFQKHVDDFTIADLQALEKQLAQSPFEGKYANTIIQAFIDNELFERNGIAASHSALPSVSTSRQVLGAPQQPDSAEAEVDAEEPQRRAVAN